MSRSETFRRLVGALTASDVIVHVRHQRVTEGLRGSLDNRVVEAHGTRYLRIAIDARGADARVISLIAHELQHAVEVARSPDVGRGRDVAEYFEKIADLPCRNARCFETGAAVDVQEAVRRELR